MRILWDNKLKTATMTASSEDPDYPVSNIVDDRLSRIFKSVTLDINIVIEETITASYVCLAGTNIPAGTTVKIQGNNTNVWSAPSFESELDNYGSYWIANFNQATYAFWRITVGDFGTDADYDYVSIGYAFLGIYLQMPGMKPDQGIDKETTDKQSLSFSGQVYGDEGYQFRSPKINFPAITNSKRGDIDEMYSSVGIHTPIIVLIWALELDFESPLFCVIEDKKLPWKRTASYVDQWSVAINFREVF